MENDLILNNENKIYAKESLDKIVDMGLNFKLQDNFRKKHISKQIIEEIFKMPINTTKLEDVIEFTEKQILPYCSNFGTENLWDFQMREILLREYQEQYYQTFCNKI